MTETSTGSALDAARDKAKEWRLMTGRVKAVLVERLELPIPSDWITDDQPLFGRGLELDSLDALELSMAIDQEFGTPIYEDNTSQFGSVSAFLGYIIERQAELPPEEAQRLKQAVLERGDLTDEERAVLAASPLGGGPAAAAPADEA